MRSREIRSGRAWLDGQLHQGREDRLLELVYVDLASPNADDVSRSLSKNPARMYALFEWASTRPTASYEVLVRNANLLSLCRRHREQILELIEVNRPPSSRPLVSIESSDLAWLKAQVEQMGFGWANLPDPVDGALMLLDDDQADRLENLIVFREVQITKFSSIADDNRETLIRLMELRRQLRGDQ